MVSLWLFSILLGIMCPFTVVFGTLLTVVCVDIGFVGDVVGNVSIYGRKKIICLQPRESFSINFAQIFKVVGGGKKVNRSGKNVFET